MGEDQQQDNTKEQENHSKKMEALGTLAGGIAHDFNNTLSVIIGYASLLQKNLANRSPEKRYLDKLLSAAKKSASLTESLLNFSRNKLKDPSPACLNTIIENSAKIFFRFIPENIDLRVKLTDKELTIMTTEGQIEQVLINLASNARDAMPGGGVLTISTEYLSADKESGLFIDSCSDIYAVISISDTGTGMDETIKEKIFDPFYTTKENDSGTGLGLSIVYGIIKQHKGQIDLNTKPGEGTTFTIYLPLTSYQPEPVEPEIYSITADGTETVLIAEDNKDVRKVAAIMLKQNGYKVIEAVDGEDAINKFIDNRKKIQILLLDLVMPKKNGREVYKEIKKMEPLIKVLFISGYSTEHEREGDSHLKKINFLSKPHISDELIDRIKELTRKDS